MSSSGSDVIPALIGVVLVIAAALAALYVLIFFVLPATLACGTALGAGIAGVNYVRAFVNNVRPEGDHDGTTAKVILGLFAFAAVAATGVIIYLKY